MASTALMSNFNNITVNVDPNDPLPFRIGVSAAMVDENGDEVQGPGGDWFNGPLASWSSTAGPSDSAADIRTKIEAEIRLNFQDDTITFVWIGG